MQSAIFSFVSPVRPSFAELACDETPYGCGTCTSVWPFADFPK
jgi:hypothetical protein